MKHILITGSTDGIGKLAAQLLIVAGHHVIVHGRNTAKVKDVVADLQAHSDGANVSSVTADLSDINQLKLIKDHISEIGAPLDILINNAGVFNSASSKIDQGLDLRFMVNYIAPYHLTNLLTPLMSDSSDKRIINLGSAAQESVSLNALDGSTSTSERSAYAQSKLALTMWSFYLGKSLKSFTVIPVNPGSLLNTKMVREAFGRHWSSADKGAQILASLSTDSKYQGITGQYFDNDLGNPIGAFGTAHQDAYDDAKIHELIQATEGIIEKIKL